MIPDALVALCYLSTLSWPFLWSLGDIYTPALEALYRGATFAYLCFVYGSSFCLSLPCIDVLQLPIFALYRGTMFAYLCLV